MKIIKYCDLFCGIGAFHYTFDKLSNDKIKYECVLSCDIDDNVRKIYEKNYKIIPHSDINKIDIEKFPDIDILCGGFPCQPFSIAGKKQGFYDKNKGNLFFSVLAIIDKKNPNIVFLENVKNLLTIEGGKVINKIVELLEERKYKVAYKVLDSKNFSSPQSRQRLYIIAKKDSVYEFPNIKSNKLVKVSDIIDKNEKSYLDYTKKYKLEKCTPKKTNGPLMVYKLINKKTNKGGRQGERIYSINSCGPTVCASSGGPGSKTGLYLINKKIRKLNTNECIKMFGFDKLEYKGIVSDKKMLFYLGNSIVTNVLIELIKGLD